MLIRRGLIYWTEWPVSLDVVEWWGKSAGGGGGGGGGGMDGLLRYTPITIYMGELAGDRADDPQSSRREEAFHRVTVLYMSRVCALSKGGKEYEAK